MSANQQQGRIGVYPGTFDPITNGHLDVIQRGVRLFDELIVRHRPGLLRFAESMLGDRHASEDAVQEAFLAAYTARQLDLHRRELRHRGPGAALAGELQQRPGAHAQGHRQGFGTGVEGEEVQAGDFRGEPVIIEASPRRRPGCG